MFPTAAQRPSSAERTLSVLTTAHSMTVISDGVAQEVCSLDGAAVIGRIHLHDPVPPSSPGPAGRIPVRMEFTDVAPTPVRDRVRTRVTVTGLLAEPYDATAESTCVEFGQAVIENADGRTYVPLDALHKAVPDPLAQCEAGLLTHLVDDHSELVPLLLRLVTPAAGLTRTLPLALDRYGLTLRLEYPQTHTDVRLAFPTPVDKAYQVAPRILALLAKARRMSHRNRLPA
ncbi:DUF2470 domain-containing protein [Streptomyces sp. BE303]|uniref:DUF2470 domain-containing protein n=1 Tax=Streptomyces sp. BE303 TaxID=3002528 RepID=UPI002E79B839|nr:DUF2470 domain-containing protein [Streptomyces sp. BE303]MED7954024.1 DUF2470 domain-containing protein [Streptomyces sp. BE303]